VRSRILLALGNEGSSGLAKFTSWVYNAPMSTKVELTRQAQKQLRQVPRHVAVKLQAWVEAVEAQGFEEVRKVPGFHDEPLKGPRQGQRSIRLSRLYRAIYVIRRDGDLELASVEEVHKHEY